MNTKRMLELADLIEARPRQFDMRFFAYNLVLDACQDPVDMQRNCGTVGCLAGFTCGFFNDGGDSRSEPVMTTARNLLGLTKKQSKSLFLADEDSVWFKMAEVLQLEVLQLEVCGESLRIMNWEDITAEIAARVLRLIVKCPKLLNQ